MHANRRMISLRYILQRVARVDSQSLANLSWNCRLPFSRYRGMLHHRILTVSLIPYLVIIPYIRLAGRSKRWPRSMNRDGANFRLFVVQILLAHAEGEL